MKKRVTREKRIRSRQSQSLRLLQLSVGFKFAICLMLLLPAPLLAQSSLIEDKQDFTDYNSLTESLSDLAKFGKGSGPVNGSGSDYPAGPRKDMDVSSYEGNPSLESVETHARQNIEKMKHNVEILLRDGDLTSLIQQAAEQGFPPDKIGIGLLQEVPMSGQYNAVYAGLQDFYDNTIVGSLFRQMGQLTGKWASEFVEGPVADTVQFLASFLKVFVQNPNVAVNALTGKNAEGAVDDISPIVRAIADVVFAIAIDLSLLLFVLCIWRYWADAAWRGSGSLMSSVGRLIFTTGLIFAWPSLYGMEIAVSNEMIRALFESPSNNLDQIAVALSVAIKSGFLAGAGALAHALAPVVGSFAGGMLGGAGGGMIGGTVGGIIGVVGLIIYLIIGAVLIGQLLYLLVLKAIQTALLTAQYMFAPIFLVFSATPDTENVSSSFVRSFVEVSLWTFFWVGLLKLLAVVIASNGSPWGRGLMGIGILQIMIQVPGFIARAQISPISEYVHAGMLTGGILKGIGALREFASFRANQAVDYLTNQAYAARGLEKSTAATMNGLRTAPNDVNYLRSLQGNLAHGLSAPPLRKEPADSDQLAQHGNLGQEMRTGLSSAGKVPDMAAGKTSGTPIVAAGNPLSGANLPPGKELSGSPVNSSTPPQNVSFTGKKAPGSANVNPQAPLNPLADAVGINIQNPQLGGFVDPLTTNLPHSLQASGNSNQNVAPEKRAHDLFDQKGYKFVEPKVAAQEAWKYEGPMYEFSQDGTNSLVGGNRGNLLKIRARAGATPSEVAQLIAVGGYARYIANDEVAFDAARQSAIDAGEDGPLGVWEKAAAGYLAHTGRSFKQTQIAKQRFSKALFKHASLGAQAYLNGESGNAYTGYLNQRFGEWSDKDDAWLIYIMTDPTSPESPLNPSYGVARQSVFGAGYLPGYDKVAAANNQFVRKVHPSQRVLAIAAVGTYVGQLAKQQFPEADEKELATVMGRIAPNISNGEVEACLALQLEGGENAVTPANVRMLTNLAAVTEMRSPEAYRAYKYHQQILSAPKHASNLAGVNNPAYYSVAAMDKAGFDYNQMLSGKVVDLAGGYMVDSPHLLASLAQAARVVGNDVEDVHVQMVAAGFAPHVVANPQASALAAKYLHSQPHLLSSLSQAARVVGQEVGDVHVQMVAAGFAPHLISNPQVSGLASKYLTSQPHLLSSLSQAARIVGNDVEDVHVQMVASGFDNHLVANSDVAEIARGYCQSTPSSLAPVLAVARIRGSDTSNYAVETVSRMVGAGWNINQISDDDLTAAESLGPSVVPTLQTVRNRHRELTSKANVDLQQPSGRVVPPPSSEPPPVPPPAPPLNVPPHGP